MARSISINGFSHTGKQLFKVHPFWWQLCDIEANPGFVKIEDKYFTQYDLRLSIQEFQELHHRLRFRLENDACNSPSWIKVTYQRLAVLDDAVGFRSNEYSHFIVRIFEGD